MIYIWFISEIYSVSFLIIIEFKNIFNYSFQSLESKN